MQTLRLGAVVRFLYTNHRDVTEQRRVVVLGLQFGSNEYYREPQWLLQTFDLERKNFRSFALAKIDTETLVAFQ